MGPHSVDKGRGYDDRSLVNYGDEMQTELLNERQTADLLGCSIRTLQAWRARGEGPPSIYIGKNRLIRYSKQDISYWLESRKKINTHTNVDQIEIKRDI